MTSANSHKRLIVNADDYGLTASVSAGIRRVHQEGILTSTTAMMNMPRVEAELETALKECPRLGLGVHLVLTTGKPVLPPDQVRSLLPLFEELDFGNWVAHIDALRDFDYDELEAEWRAQIDKFVRATGRTPDHLDAHHHSAYYTPESCNLLIKIARELGCGIRRPFNDDDADDAFWALTDDMRARSVEEVPSILREASDVPRPDYFEGRFYDTGATREMLYTIIDQLPESVSELMCHPGIVDAHTNAVTKYNAGRARELELLIDPSLHERLRSCGIELITFGGLNQDTDEYEKH